MSPEDRERLTAFGQKLIDRALMKSDKIERLALRMRRDLYDAEDIIVRLGRENDSVTAGE